MGKRTPLYDSHAHSGAKLVDFAGWDMPLHYGSQLEEHGQVRRAAGMFDVSHMLALEVTGSESAAFLAYLLANDIGKLKAAGKALYSCMLNAAGGVIDDLIVYHFHAEHYRLVVNAGTADKDLAWIALQAEPYAVQITPRHDLAMIAVQGPQARARFAQAFPAKAAQSAALAPFYAVCVGDWLIARTGYTGEDGFELALPAAQAAAVWADLARCAVTPCGLGCRDTLRLEAGMNLYGQDMDENVTPLESGLAWTVALSAQRDFIGKSALLAQPATRQLLGLVLQERGVLRAHQIVHSAEGDGEITSGSYSPVLQQGIALARLPKAVAVGDQVSVAIRSKKHPARVVQPPFVRNGKAMI